MVKQRAIPWWAEEPWWEDAKYAIWLECDKGELDTAASCMKAHFDRRWWDQICSSLNSRTSPIAGWLLGTGLQPCRFIFRLGTQLHQLRHCDGLATKIRELKEGPKALSVLFELEVAAALVREQLDVSFPPEADSRSPDIIVVTGGSKMAVECKRLEERDVDSWTHELLSRTIEGLPKDSGFGFHITLAPDLSFLRKDKPAAWNVEITRALVNEIQAAIGVALRTSPVPTQVDVPGIAEVAIQGGESAQGSVQGGLRLPATEVRRVIEYVWEASSQIPEGMPGVLAVHGDFSPGRSLARAAFMAAIKAPPKHARVERLVGIVLVPSMPLSVANEPLAIESDGMPPSESARRVLHAIVSLGRA